MRSFWLSENPRRKRALRFNVRRSGNQTPVVEFEIFDPLSGTSVPAPSVDRAKATCLCCEGTLAPERVRAQLAVQHGGGDAIFDENGRRIGGARMLAVVTTCHSKKSERLYRLPTDHDYKIVALAQTQLAKTLSDWEKSGEKGISPVPDELLPPPGTLGFNVRAYGMTQWRHLFTARQKLMLKELSEFIGQSGHEVGDSPAFFMGQVVRHCNINSKWHRRAENVAPAFAMQTLPITWDFPELSPFVNFSGSISTTVDRISCLFAGMSKIAECSGQVQQADACEHPLSDESASVWFTDPPYYDAIPYADLSDFFFVWMKRALPGHSLLRDPFDGGLLSPKSREVIQNKNREFDNGLVKDKEFYEKMMTAAFAEGRRILRDDGIASVIFAHKTTKGWEALISGLIASGWTITASWPIATESPSRLRARESASLTTSVHLVCRPRPEDTGIGEWTDVLRELPIRVGDWMERLQKEGIGGADLIFACIGPALEIFSRYSKVQKTDDSVVGLAEYLERVWEVVARKALEQILGTAEAKARNGAAGAVEADARLTALFLWTMRTTKGANGGGDEEKGEDDGESKAAKMSLPYDVVRRFTQPLGINLDEWEGRIVKTDKGVVSLLPVSSRSRPLLGDSIKASVAQNHRASESVRSLFEEKEVGKHLIKGRKAVAKSEKSAESAESDLRGRTTLDRVHTAMLLQKSGQSVALREFVQKEKERSPHFERLVNSLAGLYPRGGEELRWVEGVALYAK